MALPLKEFRRLDLNSEELGVPVRRLMANAGKALADAVRQAAPDPCKVVLLCGKGNNGGDGFAAAGVLLRWGYDIHVATIDGEPAGDVARQYLELLPADRVHAWSKDRRRWKGAGVVVDCLLGSGIQGVPRPPYDGAIRWFNKQAVKISCDVPSGLGTRLAAKPDTTVTFHAEKDGMAGRSGAIVVADIGIPDDAGDVGLGDLDAGFIGKPKDAHKGDHGRVLVVGGGAFDGAPHYAGMGAVRAGADLVHVATPDKTAAIIATWGPDLLVHATGPALDTEVIAAHARNVEALILGPGAGLDEATMATLRAVLDATTQPAVIDADGLAALDEATLRRHGKRLILTPHAAERKRLMGDEGLEGFASRFGVVVLAKGASDTITDGQRTRRCHRGHPAMAVGGTGDVLAGACAALLARGGDRFDVACAAAYLVASAGEVAASLRSYGATATDVHEAMPAVLLRLG